MSAGGYTNRIDFVCSLILELGYLARRVVITVGLLAIYIFIKAYSTCEAAARP